MATENRTVEFITVEGYENFMPLTGIAVVDRSEGIIEDVDIAAITLEDLEDGCYIEAKDLETGEFYHSE